MARKPRNRDSAATADEGSAAAAPDIEPPPPLDSAPASEPGVLEAIERQNRQIEELGRLTAGLAELMAETRVQAQRDSAFLSAVESVRGASTAVAAAANLRQAPAAAAGGTIPGLAVDPRTGAEMGCDGGLCECTSPNCCCFQIWMTSVRVLAMQPVEIMDSNLNPWADIEVQMFAYLDGGTGAVIPSLFSYLTLGKLAQYPGPKVSVERPIGTVCLRKGRTRIVTVTVDAIESDKGLLERLTGGRDEEGSNSGTMVLDCCCSQEPKLIFDVQFTAGGQGGGAIQVEFAARRSC
jgi:hypothetical protein